MNWSRYKERAKLSRRKLLGGLGLGAGGLLLSPIFQSLHAQAQGDAPRKRLVIVVEGNGYHGFQRWERLNHASTQITPLTNMAEQAPMVMGWEPWRDQVNVINGLSNKQGVGQGAGHRAHWYALCAMPYAGANGPGGPSIDTVLAEEIANPNVVFPVLRIGAVDEQRTLAPVNCAAGRNAPVSSQHNPLLVWQELFGVASPNPEDQRAFQERSFIMDALADDVRRASSRLTGDDRWKFERYLFSIETFQRQQQALAARADTLMTCSPPEPSSPEGMDTGLAFSHQVVNATAALACGLTEIVVLSVASGPFSLGADFSGWGFGGRHTMGHGQGATDSQPGGVEGLTKIHSLLTGELAYLIEELNAIPEGDGTMWDNSAIVFLNDNGDAHHAKYDNYPVTSVGTLGGNLRTGSYIEVPNREQPGAVGLGQFWNTIAHAMGVPLNTFGEGGEAPFEGPIAELLT
ncbi:MAG: DUF1552 domain-containing protein [Myxococcota bacterium]